MRKVLIFSFCLLFMTILITMCFANDTVVRLDSQTGWELDWAYNDTKPAIGIQFNATCSITGAYLHLNVGGNASFKAELYTWVNNYDDTISGSPVTTTTLNANGDNFYSIMFENAQPAGEYILLLTIISHDAHVITTFDNKATDVNFSKCRLYYGGTVQTNKVLVSGIYFADTDGSLADVSEEIDAPPGNVLLRLDSQVGWEVDWAYNDTKPAIGIQFNAKGSITGAFLHLNIGGTASFKTELYEWDNNYDNTISGSPVTTTTLNANGDNFYSIMFENTQPAGEYILLLTIISHDAHIITTFDNAASDENFALCKLYYGGIVQENKVLISGIYFADSADAGYNAVHEDQINTNPQTGDFGISIGMVFMSLIVPVLFKKKQII